MSDITFDLDLSKALNHSMGSLSLKYQYRRAGEYDIWIRRRQIPNIKNKLLWIKDLFAPGIPMRLVIPYAVVLTTSVYLYFLVARNTRGVIISLVTAKPHLILLPVAGLFIFYLIGKLFHLWEREIATQLLAMFLWVMVLLSADLYISSGMDPQIGEAALVVYVFGLFFFALIIREPAMWSACLVSVTSSHVAWLELRNHIIDYSLSNIGFAQLFIGFSAPLIMFFILGYSAAMEQAEKSLKDKERKI
jgi:hypothetical protein